ncbi:hypothetical protein STEG23_021256, partial [Scotinomys teguina]
MLPWRLAAMTIKSFTHESKREEEGKEREERETEREREREASNYLTDSGTYNYTPKHGTLKVYFSNRSFPMGAFCSRSEVRKQKSEIKHLWKHPRKSIQSAKEVKTINVPPKMLEIKQLKQIPKVY